MKPFVAELVLKCGCGRETLRAKKSGTPAEITRWAEGWAAAAGRLKQVCGCGAELVLERDERASVAVQDMHGRPARDAAGKAVRVTHGVRLKKRKKGRSAPPATNNTKEPS